MYAPLKHILFTFRVNSSLISRPGVAAKANERVKLYTQLMHWALRLSQVTFNI